MSSVNALPPLGATFSLGKRSVFSLLQANASLGRRFLNFVLCFRSVKGFWPF